MYADLDLFYCINLGASEITQPHGNITTHMNISCIVFLFIVNECKCEAEQSEKWNNAAGNEPGSGVRGRRGRNKRRVKVKKRLGLKYEKDRNKKKGRERERVQMEAKLLKQTDLALCLCLHTNQWEREWKNDTKKIGRPKMEDECRQDCWYYLLCFSYEKRKEC